MRPDEGFSAEGVNRQGENPAWLWQHGSDHRLSGDQNRAVL